MADWLGLYEILCEIVNITEPNGDRHVYYDPPESVKMKYPAIKFSLNDINNKHANNSVYKQDHSYEVTVIYDDPSCDISDKVSKLPSCRFSRHYKADNLNHDTYTIFHK